MFFWEISVLFVGRNIVGNCLAYYAQTVPGRVNQIKWNSKEGFVWLCRTAEQPGHTIFPHLTFIEHSCSSTVLQSIEMSWSSRSVDVAMVGNNLKPVIAKWRQIFQCLTLQITNGRSEQLGRPSEGIKEGSCWGEPVTHIGVRHSSVFCLEW